MPFSEGEALADRAETVGLPHAFHALEGAGHAPWHESGLFLEVIPPFLYRHVVLDE